METTLSIGALIAVGIASFFGVAFVVPRLKTVGATWALVGGIWCVAIALIVLVDVNVPLSASHYAANNAPAPLWVALFAIFARFAALSVVILAAPRIRSPSSEH